MVEKRVNAGVAVIMFDPAGRILMGKRKGSHGAGSWSFPGGWIDEADQTLADAAKREVREETGMEVENLDVIGATYTHFAGGGCSVTILMVAGVNRGSPVSLEPDKLDGEWTWFEPNSLPSPLFEPLYNLDYIRNLH